MTVLTLGDIWLVSIRKIYLFSFFQKCTLHRLKVCLCAHRSQHKYVWVWSTLADTTVLVSVICVFGVAWEYFSDAQLSLTQRMSSVSYVSGFACLCQCLHKIRRCVNHPQLAIRSVGVREGRKRSRVGYCYCHLLFFFCITCYYLIIFSLTVFWTKSTCFQCWPQSLPPSSPVFLILSIPISSLVLSLWVGWRKHAAWGPWFEVWQTYRHCSVISPVFTTAEKVLNASLQGADGLRLPRPTEIKE